MPPPGELSASSNPPMSRIQERTWIDPLHAIGIGIIAANAEAVGSAYVATVESGDVTSRM